MLPTFVIFHFTEQFLNLLDLPKYVCRYESWIWVRVKPMKTVQVYIPIYTQVSDMGKMFSQTADMV